MPSQRLFLLYHIVAVRGNTRLQSRQSPAHARCLAPDRRSVLLDRHTRGNGNGPAGWVSTVAGVQLYRPQRRETGHVGRCAHTQPGCKSFLPCACLLSATPRVYHKKKRRLIKGAPLCPRLSTTHSRRKDRHALPSIARLFAHAKPFLEIGGLTRNGNGFILIAKIPNLPKARSNK